jgi:hypothetical protein
MIDWPTALTYAAAVTGSPARTQAVVAEVLRTAPVFRNKEFPLSVLPVVIRHSAAVTYVRSAEAYVELLDKIVRLYVAEEEVRRWYGLDAAAEALVLADQRLGGDVAVCRLDGYLEQGTERPFLLENNADAPAGTLFTARINELVRCALDAAGVPTRALSPLTYAGEGSLLAALVDCVRRAGDSDPADVAILQPTGAANRESIETALALQGLGINAFVADPRTVEVSGPRVSFGGRPADVCWNKVNTASWRRLVGADPDVVQTWMRAVDATSFVHVNPFGARYVAENKLSLALPQEARFAHLFTAAERELAVRFLPWAARLTKESTAPEGAMSLYDDLLERPADYVLKEPYDIRGDGVSIGRSIGRDAWEKAAGRALAEHHLVQRYLPPASYPTLRAGDPAVVSMPISMDTYVFNGRVHGFGSKASLNARVNVFQGGQKLAVHVVDDEHDVNHEAGAGAS